jgi:hypothetical protein
MKALDPGREPINELTSTNFNILGIKRRGLRFRNLQLSTWNLQLFPSLTRLVSGLVFELFE